MIAIIGQIYKIKKITKNNKRIKYNQTLIKATSFKQKDLTIVNVI